MFFFFFPPVAELQKNCKKCASRPVMWDEERMDSLKELRSYIWLHSFKSEYFSPTNLALKKAPTSKLIKELGASQQYLRKNIKLPLNYHQIYVQICCRFLLISLFIFLQASYPLSPPPLFFLRDPIAKNQKASLSLQYNTSQKYFSISASFSQQDNKINF